MSPLQPTLEQIANELRRQVRESGLTQQEIADRAGLNRVTVASWLNKKPGYGLSPAKLDAVAQAIGKKIDVQVRFK